jgi:hypothetical protein
MGRSYVHRDSPSSGLTAVDFSDLANEGMIGSSFTESVRRKGHCCKTGLVNTFFGSLGRAR